jgi:cytochrome P450 family 6
MSSTPRLKREISETMRSFVFSRISASGQNTKNPENTRNLYNILIFLQNFKLSVHICDVVSMLAEFTDTMLAAQAFIFFLAGFETSSTTLSFCLHELALNPQIQERLREEIDSTLKKCEGKVTYDALQNMPYLDQVLDGE